jgi:hypothetical protein
MKADERADGISWKAKDKQRPAQRHLRACLLDVRHCCERERLAGLEIDFLEVHLATAR